MNYLDLCNCEFCQQSEDCYCMCDRDNECLGCREVREDQEDDVKLYYMEES